MNATTGMNAKISIIVICVEVNIYLLLYSLIDHTFKKNNNRHS